MSTVLSDRISDKAVHRVREPAKWLLLAFSYVVTGAIGQTLAIPPGNITLVWPPSGIALAALLLWGDRLWPGIWLGSFLVNLYPIFSADRSVACLSVIALIATGSTVQALVGRRLISRFAGGRVFLDKATGVFLFTAAATVMCLIASTVAALSMAGGGLLPVAGILKAWMTWWLGDTAGVLVFTPLIVAWAGRKPARWGREHVGEGLLFISLLAGMCYFIFGGWLPRGQPTAYLVFPTLIWVAFRFGQRGTTAAVFFTAAMACWSTIGGEGPFQTNTLQGSLWLLQVFVSVVAVSSLSLAAVVAERKQTVGTLEQSNENLEQRVTERAAEAQQRALDLGRSEQTRRGQAATLQSILDSVLEGIIVADPDGRFRMWNPAAERIIGKGLLEIPPEEWPSHYGCFLSDQVTPFPWEQMPLVRAVRGEVLREVEVFIRNEARDEGVWLSVSGTPLKNAAGESLGGVVALRDVTENKQAEQRLKSVIESVLAGVVMADDQGVITLTNQHADSMFGYRRGELIGCHVDVLIPDAHRESYNDYFQEYLKKPKPQAMAEAREFQCLRKDGILIDVRVTLTPIRNGDRLSVLASVLDVTAQKRATELIHSVVEFAPDGTVMVDHEGRILLVNLETERMFGYSREELYGQPVEALVPERIRAPHSAKVRGFLVNGHQRSMNQGRNLSACRKDGAEFPVDISLHSFVLDGERFTIASVRDMTERQRLVEAVETNLVIQETIAKILRNSLDAIGLDEHLEKTLDLILSVPWFSEGATGGIFVCVNNNTRLSLRAQRGLAPEVVENCSSIPVGYCMCGRAAEHREIIFASCLDQRHEFHYNGQPGHSNYCVPILGEDRLYGVISVFLNDSHRERRPEEEVFLSSVAGVLAGTIERKRTEEALRESEERFGLAVRGTDAGIWDWDLRTGRVYYSPRWKSMLGHSDEELRDELDEWKTRLHPDDAERAESTIKAYLEGRSSEYELEHRLRHKDGTYRWILARGAAVRDARGLPYRMVGSQIDITVNKQTEAQLVERLAHLRAAQRIQQALLPKQSPSLPGFDIAGIYIPAAFAGGDMFDYLKLVGGNLGVVIGDVSGHGIGAALLMASTAAFIRALALSCSGIHEIMNRVNRLVYDETDEDFVTMIMVQVDPIKGTLLFANAGHPYGYVITADSSVRAQLSSSRLPLGILPNLDFPVGQPIQLQAGDIVALVTDGLLEAESPEGEMYGEARMLQVLRDVRHRTSQEILESLHEAARNHSKREVFLDDFTAVVIKVTELPPQ